ncbi:uncharacterized protein LOC114311727 [Camellia sinensis]|uniref:uncharacterized protein LOC114311727 n=1 Tax=Camellia sinensis TaxID=4442 RepID=UPI001035FAE3|nr:uncharacterized protein LOC114311727 [Camellia sinensis]
MEIWAVVSEYNGNKAPGPDGFNLIFFQKTWGTIKEEMLNFMKEFHSGGRLVSGLNSTFITHIPKKIKAVNLKEFRPISLVGSVYKILSKVLATRLKRVIPMVIGDSQSAFMGERNILDGILIANEDFLFSMLSNFGFGTKWISRIKECVSTVKLSILVNGSPTKEFTPQKGIRKGDPLSPFLFILVAKALNILLQRARELGLLKGVNIGVNQVVLSHLQFANDSLLFYQAEVLEVLCLKRVLRCFELASGLKINYPKSVLCGVGISDSSLHEFASVLHCKAQKLPLKYLGLPLGASPRRKKTWKPVIDKIKLRLAGWKRRSLSFASRLTLIKAVLSSLPVYFLSLFRVPEGIAKEIDQIQAAFLWGGPDLKRTLYLVKWSEVTKSIKQGGLGIKRIRDVNVCLLLKWWWRFANEHDSLWKKVLCSKYRFQGEEWLPILGPGITSSRIWGDILTTVEQKENLLLFYVSNLQLRVGNGYRIKFWHDKWCGGIILKEEFPRLFQLSNDKDSSIKDLVCAPTGAGKTNIAMIAVLHEDRSILERKAERRIWSAILLVALWSIWKHRNECLFQGSQPKLEELLELIITRIAIWYKVATKGTPFFIDDFLHNISQIRFYLVDQLVSASAFLLRLLSYDLWSDVAEMAVGGLVIAFGAMQSIVTIAALLFCEHGCSDGCGWGWAEPLLRSAVSPVALMLRLVVLSIIISVICLSNAPAGECVVAFLSLASSEYSAERQLNDLLFPRSHHKLQKKKEARQTEL